MEKVLVFLESKTYRSQKTTDRKFSSPTQILNPTLYPLPLLRSCFCLILLLRNLSLPFLFILPQTVAGSPWEARHTTQRPSHLSENFPPSGHFKHYVTGTLTFRSVASHFVCTENHTYNRCYFVLFKFSQNNLNALSSYYLLKRSLVPYILLLTNIHQ